MNNLKVNIGFFTEVLFFLLTGFLLAYHLIILPLIFFLLGIITAVIVGKELKNSTLKGMKKWQTP
jgi:uncharacterized membrane protein